MTIVNAQIYYPSTIDPITGALTAQTVTAYDLRKIIAWSDAPSIGSLPQTTVRVLFDPTGQVWVGPWPKGQFETAKTASLVAGG